MPKHLHFGSESYRKHIHIFNFWFLNSEVFISKKSPINLNLNSITKHTFSLCLCIHKFSPSENQAKMYKIQSKVFENIEQNIQQNAQTYLKLVQLILIRLSNFIFAPTDDLLMS